MHAAGMALLTEDELSEIRGRHMRAVRGADDEVELAASIAHQDRERLLGAVEQLLPVFEAARLVARMIQRGPLPLAARQALLELHVALEGVVEVEHVRDAALADALAASLEDVDDEEAVEPARPGLRPGRPGDEVRVGDERLSA